MFQQFKQRLSVSAFFMLSANYFGSANDKLLARFPCVVNVSTTRRKTQRKSVTMSDDRTQRSGPLDRSLINTSEDY